MVARNQLLIGAPGCGKTTVLLNVIELLGNLRLADFYTEEIRQRGRRLGFRAVGLGGGASVLAHADLRTGIRVGRYGVELAAFNPVVQTELGTLPGEVRSRQKILLLIFRPS